MEHITYMASVAEQVRDMRDEICNSNVLMLACLPESHENFIPSLDAHKVEDLKWEKVKSLLIKEYAKRKEKQTESPGQNDALFSKTNSHSYSSRGRNHAAVEVEGIATMLKRQSENIKST